MIYEQYFKNSAPTINEMWPKDLMAEVLSETERVEDLRTLYRLRKSLMSDDKTKEEKRKMISRAKILGKFLHFSIRNLDWDSIALFLFPLN